MGNLTNLVFEVQKIIENSSPGCTTNYCDNFHSIKSRLCPRNINFGKGWLGRIYCCILQFKFPDFWIIKTLALLNCGTLPQAIMVYFMRIVWKHKQDHLRKLDPNHQLLTKKHNAMRRSIAKKESSTKSKNNFDFFFISVVFLFSEIFQCILYKYHCLK